MRHILVNKLIKLIPNNYQNKQQGFTLAEMIVVIIILGILASVTIASIVGQMRQNEANNAFTQLENALRSAQSNAMKFSQQCDVTINDSGNPTNYTITGNTFVDDEGVTRNCVPESISIRHKAGSEIITSIKRTSDKNISFNFQGVPLVGSNQTIVVYNNATKQGRCLVISGELGLIRTGSYNGDPNQTITPNSCVNIENIRYEQANP